MLSALLSYLAFTFVYCVFLSLLTPIKQSLQIDSVLPFSMIDAPVWKKVWYKIWTADDKVLYEMWPFDYKIV